MVTRVVGTVKMILIGLIPGMATVYVVTMKVKTAIHGIMMVKALRKAKEAYLKLNVQ